MSMRTTSPKSRGGGRGPKLHPREGERERDAPFTSPKTLDAARAAQRVDVALGDALVAQHLPDEVDVRAADAAELDDVLGARLLAEDREEARRPPPAPPRAARGARGSAPPLASASARARVAALLGCVGKWRKTRVHVAAARLHGRALRARAGSSSSGRRA